MTLGKSDGKANKKATFLERRKTQKKLDVQRKIRERNGGKKRNDVHSRDLGPPETSPYNYNAFLRSSENDSGKTELGSKNWVAYFSECEVPSGNKRKRDDGEINTFPQPQFTFSEPTWCTYCGINCQQQKEHNRIRKNFERSLVKAVARNDMELSKDIIREMKELQSKSGEEDDGEMGAAAAAASPPEDADKARYKHLTSELHYALMVAVTYWSNIDIVRMLLESGATPGFYNNWDSYPILLSAVDINATDIVQLLISYGADVTLSRPGATALHIAAMKGNIDMLQLLKDNGMTNVNITESNQGRTPLHVAAQWNRCKVLTYLLDQGADVNSKDNNQQTALHIATKYGHKAVVEWLITHGADLTAMDNNNTMAWMMALTENYNNILELLITKHGHDFADEEGMHPIHHVSCSKNEGSIKIISFLLQQGVSINVRDASGRTPLMCATSEHNRTTMTYLIEHGANLNIADNEGKSVLLAYVEEWDVFSDTIWLLELGASANDVSNDGDNILQRYVKCLQDSDNLAPLSKLLEKNIDLSISRFEDSDGTTPVMKAIQSKNSDLVKTLVNAGCSLKNVRTWLASEESRLGDTDDFMPTVVWLRQRVHQPSSLQELCRSPILAQIGHNQVDEKLLTLPLPRLLKMYLHPMQFLKMNEIDNN